MSDLWRWSTGRKGVNRVTVYERRNRASLYVEWWDDEGRHQKTLTWETGYPVTDKEVAKQIAKRMADRQKERLNQNALDSTAAVQPRRTVAELFGVYFAHKKDGWSEEHLKHQKRFRDFWKDKLGARTRLVTVNAAQVEAVASKEAKKRGWSKRTRRAYLMFVVAAFYFAERKKKWIDQRHNLSAVDLPSPKKKRAKLSYSTEEAVALLDALHTVDRRAAAVGEIALMTGRRLNAIRTLPKASYEPLDDDTALLHFPSDTDKAGVGGEAVIAGRAKDAVEAILDMDGPWLFPRKRDPERPMAPEMLTRLLHDAEDEADIEHVKGRAWHGLKRRFATLAGNHRAAPHQASTRRDTLEGRYEQDDLAPKVELAKRVARLREKGV